MWRMLQHDGPGDFVVARGEAYSVRDFVELAFDVADLDWRECVEIDAKYFRPTEVDYLLGDPSKARSELGWKPQTGFKELVQMMVASDMLLPDEERYVCDRQYTTSGSR